MTDINNVVLVGRLTHDLGNDERNWGFLPNGQARANVSVAVNRNKKSGDEWVNEVSYFDIAIFGKTAENLKPYLLKGKQIAVEGHLKQDRWKDQQGNNKSRISIVAKTVQLLGAKSDGENTDGASTDVYKQNFTPKSNVAPYTPPQEFNGEEFPEDIPF